MKSSTKLFFLITLLILITNCCNKVDEKLSQNKKKQHTLEMELDLLSMLGDIYCVAGDTVLIFIVSSANLELNLS